ncbi:THAP domain-containing protein 3 [Trichonephila clavipes]|nr:THAP domain-containing protein 3 [Trichonephila clavipes]
MSHCAAYGCTNYRKKEECKSKSFFKFPVKNPGLLKAWLKMIRRENFKPSAHSLICSDHFEETCFEYQPFTNRRQLKRGSIPTIFVFKRKPHLEGFWTDEMEPSTTSAGTQTDTFGSTVSRDFNFVTDVLYEKLKLQDVFPSKDQVIRYMPPPFRMYCKNVRIIVDCTEIEVQKPSSPMEQQMTFSRYKNANTFKGMIGITPNGAISFISELFTDPLDRTNIKKTGLSGRKPDIWQPYLWLLFELNQRQHLEAPTRFVNDSEKQEISTILYFHSTLDFGFSY